jgi:hypothetical protein
LAQVVHRCGSARHRSAESDCRAQLVGELAHFLPALHFAVNVDGDAVSPDFKALTTEADQILTQSARAQRAAEMDKR